MQVSQHVPAIFGDLGLAAFQGEVGSLAELTQLEWVKHFWVAPGFYQFSRSSDGPLAYYLLAEFAGGEHCYVVARLEGSEVGDLTRALPLWTGPRQ